MHTSGDPKILIQLGPTISTRLTRHQAVTQNNGKTNLTVKWSKHLSDREQNELLKGQRKHKGWEKNYRDLVKKPVGQSCTGCQALFSNSVHARGARECKKERKQSLLLLNTTHMLLHSCRPIQLNPVLYCTYHCGPLSPLICCQTGRPGRRPWRGSCVNHAEEKEITVETEKAERRSIPLLTNVQHAALPQKSSPPFRLWQRAITSTICRAWNKVVKGVDTWVYTSDHVSEKKIFERPKLNPHSDWWLAADSSRAWKASQVSRKQHQI